MRKLACIKIISDIIPIKGKDKIVLAIIDGWSVIVQKNEFKIGDKCIYVECDSVLPETEQFEFLRSKNFRIKTMKMAGVISQGICFPLSFLPQGNYKIEQDVTEILAIKQYEQTMDVGKNDFKQITKCKYPKWLMRFGVFRQLVYKKDHREGKGFPTFINKTDEARIQNMPHILNDKREWVCTEKVDGQSGTFCLVRRRSKIPFIKEKLEYIVCSRRLRLFSKDNSSYWRVSDRYKLESTLRNMIGNHEWVAIQGECVASNVQGNKYCVKEPDLYVFNVIYPEGRMGSIKAKELCERHGLKFVPILDTNYTLPDTVNKVLTYAHGISKLCDTLREGVVFRSIDGKQSFKAVDPLFLLKHDE